MFQDLRLLYPRCLLLHSQQKWPEFVQCAEQVLFGHFNIIFKEPHLNGNEKLIDYIRAIIPICTLITDTQTNRHF